MCPYKVKTSIVKITCITYICLQFFVVSKYPNQMYTHIYTLHIQYKQDKRIILYMLLSLRVRISSGLVVTFATSVVSGKFGKCYL